MSAATEFKCRFCAARLRARNTETSREIARHKAGDCARGVANAVRDIEDARRRTGWKP